MEIELVALNYYEHQLRHNPANAAQWINNKELIVSVFVAAYTLFRINNMLAKHRCHAVTIDCITKASHPWHNHDCYKIKTVHRKQPVVMLVSFPYSYTGFSVHQLPWDTVKTVEIINGN